MSKKILVTGGMGFIGSNFIRSLHNKYPTYSVCNVDSLTYAGNEENLRSLIENDSDWYTFRKCDISNAKSMAEVFSEFAPEVVINFAAESHVDRSLVDTSQFVLTNVVGVDILLRLVREFNVERLIHISTDEVYGDVLMGNSSEDSKFNPSNPYAASKAAADLLVQSVIKSHAVPAIVVRGSNNFGPRQYPEKLIPLIITNILSGEKIPLHGDGSHMRTWLHVDDFSDAILHILDKADNGSIYNVAGATILSNREVINLFAELLGHKFDDVVEFVNDRPSADFRYAPDGSKILSDLSWQPRFDIKSSAKEVIDWYRDNQKWWKDIKMKKEFFDHYSKQKTGKYF